MDGASRDLVGPLSICPVQLKVNSTCKVKSLMTSHAALKSKYQGRSPSRLLLWLRLYRDANSKRMKGHRGVITAITGQHPPRPPPPPQLTVDASPGLWEMGRGVLRKEWSVGMELGQGRLQDRSGILMPGCHGVVNVVR